MLSLIEAATDIVEQDTDRVLIHQQFEMSTDTFPANNQYIRLGQKPIEQIDSIEYLNEEEVNQTFDPNDYDLDDGARYIYLKPNKTWPEDVLNWRKSVRVTYTAGYGVDHQKVPQGCKRAVTILASFWFENPTSEGSRPDVYEAIIDRLIPTTYAGGPV